MMPIEETMFAEPWPGLLERRRAFAETAAPTGPYVCPTCDGTQHRWVGCWRVDCEDCNDAGLIPCATLHTDEQDGCEEVAVAIREDLTQGGRVVHVPLCASCCARWDAARVGPEEAEARELAEVSS